MLMIVTVCQTIQVIYSCCYAYISAASTWIRKALRGWAPLFHSRPP